MNKFSILIFALCFIKYLQGHTFEDTNIELDLLEKEDYFKDKQNISSDDVKFYLYTRKNPLNYEQIYVDNLPLVKGTNLDPSRPVKILIHGWRNDHKSQFNILLKNAYLTQYNTNVIVVDWGKYSKTSYLTSRYKVYDIAEILANFIDQLNNQYGIISDNIHMIGHSLGAHIAGIAGTKVNIGQIARITGLDPAGPFFSLYDENRISPEKGKFVDIIHTAGAAAGFFRGLGHVDFYPNGGTPIQPGCGMDVTMVRSHRRSFWLLAESITSPDGFMAVSCTSWTKYKWEYCNDNNRTHMGEHVSTSARGKYYLRTNSKSPYALESTSNKKD